MNENENDDPSKSVQFSVEDLANLVADLSTAIAHVASAVVHLAENEKKSAAERIAKVPESLQAALNLVRDKVREAKRDGD